MSSTDLKDRIDSIVELEHFIFNRTRFSYASPHRSHPEVIGLLKTNDSRLIKKTIYDLHDRGELRESAEEEANRLSHGQIIVGNSFQYDKLETSYLPKHYHEVLTAIREFYNLVINNSSSTAPSQKKNRSGISRALSNLLRTFRLP